MSNSIYLNQDLNYQVVISKEYAKKNKLKFYFTGIPCRNGHLSVRRTSNNTCLGCYRAWADSNVDDRSNYQKNYREVHQKHIKQLGALWRKDNEVHLKRQSKEWRTDNKKIKKKKDSLYYLNNTDKIKKNVKRWQSRNRPKTIKFNQQRGRRLRTQTPKWVEWDLVAAIYMKRDEINNIWGTTLEVDHIIPISPKDKSVCGLHCWHNLQLLDKSLNRQKSDYYQTDW